MTLATKNKISNNRTNSKKCKEYECYFYLSRTSQQKTNTKIQRLFAD